MLFSFYGYAAHRDLHSFPTRRSSDLGKAVEADPTYTLAWFNRALLRLKDRKSTRLNSSHVKTSYAVFCLKKKMITNNQVIDQFNIKLAPRLHQLLRHGNILRRGRCVP